MKNKFIVTIEGDWYYNFKKITKSQIKTNIHEALKDRFESSTNRITVENIKSEDKVKELQLVAIEATLDYAYQHMSETGFASWIAAIDPQEIFKSLEK